MMRWNLACAVLLAGALAAVGQTLPGEKYNWKSVQIVGGGFVDGVIFHPTAKNLRYARTDMGGAYRWDESVHRWQPILDWVPYKDLNLMGVESIAVDPKDPNWVAMACGTYTNAGTPNGAILRSTDQGHTWQRTDVPFKFGGNEEGRGNGERLMVDPQDSRILFLGTRHDGLWRSEDRGVTWAPVSSFPNVIDPDPPTPVILPGESEDHFWQRWPVFGAGIIFVKYLPDEKSEGPSQTIYVGVSRVNKPNLFVSHDGGKSWSEVTGAPRIYRPTRAAIASDGMMYITYGTAPGPGHMKNGAVWKLDTHTGAWKDITPDKPAQGKEFGYAAVSIDAQHPQTLIVSSFHRPDWGGGEDIFRSNDGGNTWTTIFGHGGQYDYSGAPYIQKTPIHWLFDIEIDPFDAAHAVFTTGYGGWETHDLTASDHNQPTHWSVLTPGIEETVALELNSPVKGVPLLSAIGDYGSFVHWDLDMPAPEGSASPARMGNTSGIVSATLKPEEIVRVGRTAEGKDGENIAWSPDGGHTWKTVKSSPGPRSQLGSIAVSADGATWIWTPEKEAPFVSHDRGNRWAAVRGLADSTRILADPVDSSVFYAISLSERKLYRSADKGESFSSESFVLEGMGAFQPGWRGDDRGGQDRIYATPGRKGDLWIAAWDGLFHLDASKPAAGGALNFHRLAGVEEIHGFGFGKAAPGHDDPALYLVGTIQGQYGIFRSIDAAKSWVRINDDQHQWGLVLHVIGDPKQYGRVYVGAHGRGVLYGDPAQ